MNTVADLLHNVFPDGTVSVAGASALGRDVTWATRPRPSPPAFAHLSGGELVLLSATALVNLDERLTLEAAVRQLAGFGVAAIAFLGRISAGARLAADETGLALLHLPAGADLAALEREASHQILERRRDLTRRGQEAGRRLMELAIAGETLETLLKTLMDLSHRSVALEGRDGRLHQFHAGGSGNPSQAMVEPLLIGARPALTAWLRQTIASSPAEPPTIGVALDSAWWRVAAPIIGRNGLLGSLSLLGPIADETGETEVLVSRAAAACAVVMAREHATLAARREIELNVLDEVLDGALRSEVTLLQQAKRLGHDLTHSYAVIMARIEAAGALDVARAREGRWSLFDDVIARRGARLLWRIRHNQAEVLWPAGDAADARAAGASLHEDLTRRLDGSGQVASVGVGRVASGLAGIQRSHQESRQALIMGKRLYGAGRLTPFQDLGVYRLIFAAEELGELRAFHDEALDALIEHDRGHSTDLVKTLHAFFDAKCGPKETAGLLGVHRNTVLYRLDRVRAITSFDLDDADVRLRLHLALCVHLAVATDN